MQRYAIINGTDVINVIEYESAPENPPPGFDTPVMAVQSDSAGPGFTYVKGQFIPPPPAQATPIPLIEQAQAALTKSDITMIRCLSAGLTVPTEWQAYRAALRDVLSGKRTTMPTQPSYIAGT